MKIELDDKKRIGANFILLSRVNAALDSHTLIRRKMIDEKYYEKCLFCKGEFKDHIIHWGTECIKTKDILEEWLHDITLWIKMVYKENWKIPAINYLLKGPNITGLEKRIKKTMIRKVRTL